MWYLTNLYSCDHTFPSYLWLYSSYCGTCVYVHWTVPSSPIWEGHHGTGWMAMSVVLVHGTRGGWSYYYKHGAAPITQYMAASTQFNLLSQQIIFTYEQNYTYSCHQECALDNNSITWPTSSGMGLCCPVLSHVGKDMAGGTMSLACDYTWARVHTPCIAV